MCAAVGSKPVLLREVLETAISGSDQAVPAEQRDYVARIRAAKGARKKIETYVAALVEIQPRLAPVYLALRDAAATDPDSAATWREISERRARNMRALPPTSAPPASCAQTCPMTTSRTSSGA